MQSGITYRMSWTNRLVPAGATAQLEHENGDVETITGPVLLGTDPKWERVP